VWKENKYKGFSHETTGESQTPFLNTFIQQLPLGGACVVELGAGSCDHAVRMAKEEVIIKQVTAVEFSETAVTSARQRLDKLDAGVRSRLTIECNDLFTFINKVKLNSIQGIYANSVLHFLTPKQRQDLYRQAHKALSAGGIIAVSFKTTGDALYKRGEPVEDTSAGVVIRDASDHICRLFVSPTGVNVLAAELRSAGFSVNSVLQWSVPDYNIEGDDGHFVGFIAAR
jgi:cyclopropane fatty-acyl-phospholipid synthase-like methyltransferase